MITHVKSKTVHQNNINFWKSDLGIATVQVEEANTNTFKEHKSTSEELLII